jgi:hypothetical protein
MTYYIAIPSYKRHTILPKKTWKLLIEGGVPIDRIAVFVANKDEESLYRTTLPDANIIVGVLGLVAQREFIAKQYPEGANLLFMDDDISQLKRLVDNKLVTITDIDAVIRHGFKEMSDHGSHIWGIYPAASSLYMKAQPAITTDLRYLPGGMYGINNIHPPILLYGDNKEDCERTLWYWERYKCIVRLNHVTLLTRNYAPGGMDSPTRKAQTNIYTQKLVDRWPYYVKRIYKPKHGIWDLRFLPQKEADGLDDTAMDVLPLRAGYEEAKAALLTELKKVTIPPLGKPSTPERRKHHGVRADLIGSIGRTATFGFGQTRMNGIAEFRFNKKYPDLLRALINFGNLIAEPGWRYTAITLNHGVQATKHRDKSNVGRSIIIGIGDYTDGALRVWEPDDAFYTDMDLKDRPTIFNGALRTHETQPFTGDRYTIIYYRQKWEGSCVGMPAMVGNPQVETKVDRPIGGAGIPAHDDYDDDRISFDADL